METVSRKACRAVLLTPANEVLLIKIENPDGSWVGWITPGGGIDAHESEAAALKREIYEELGLKDFNLGPKIWRRFHSFPWKGRLIEQSEVYYLVYCERFEVQPALNPDHTELLDLKEFRWWTLADVASSREQFAPRNLPSLLSDLVKNGPPTQVVDVGI